MHRIPTAHGMCLPSLQKAGREESNEVLALILDTNHIFLNLLSFNLKITVIVKIVPLFQDSIPTVVHRGKYLCVYIYIYNLFNTDFH